MLISESCNRLLAKNFPSGAVLVRGRVEESPARSNWIWKRGLDSERN
jgi:hypothetical protein